MSRRLWDLYYTEHRGKKEGESLYRDEETQKLSIDET